MNDANQMLRNIPKVDDILAHPLLAGASHTLAKEATRNVLDALRQEVLSGVTALPEREILVQRIVARLQQDAQPSLRKVINATGVVLHTNLGRAPMARSALEAVTTVAEGYCTLEYNVEQGKRGSRHDHVSALLAKLTGAEDAIAVNNNAAAVLLMLSALATGKEVVVSRGELVEIGGAFRIPDVMVQSGCMLREVGTTNRTRAADYEAVVDAERTGALLKAHSSNYRIVGFTEEVPLEDLVALGKAHHLPVLYDLGSGAMLCAEQLDLHGEPVVRDCIAAGVDVVSFSGDKLLGGPQAGMIVGKREYIAKMKKHPLARALRIDKMTLAALEATLQLYLDPARAIEEIPVLAMLSATPDMLRAKAEQLMQKLVPLGGQAEIADEQGQVGGGSVPGETVPTVAVAITPKTLSPDELEQRLRGWATPIIGRISKDRLLLDMRTVDETELVCVADCLNAVLGGQG